MHENTNLGDTDTDTDNTGKQIPNSIENCTCILGCPVLLESERPPATLTGPLERGVRSIITAETDDAFIRKAIEHPRNIIEVFLYLEAHFDFRNKHP